MRPAIRFARSHLAGLARLNGTEYEPHVKGFRNLYLILLISQVSGRWASPVNWAHVIAPLNCVGIFVKRNYRENEKLHNFAISIFGKSKFGRYFPEIKTFLD